MSFILTFNFARGTEVSMKMPKWMFWQVKLLHHITSWLQLWTSWPSSSLFLRAIIFAREGKNQIPDSWFSLYWVFGVFSGWNNSQDSSKHLACCLCSKWVTKLICLWFLPNPCESTAGLCCHMLSTSLALSFYGNRTKSFKGIPYLLASDAGKC